jgi:hypothetical protein
MLLGSDSALRALVIGVPLVAALDSSVPGGVVWKWGSIQLGGGCRVWTVSAGIGGTAHGGFR